MSPIAPLVVLNNSTFASIMHKDILFRGCTRPPMILGVPYVPFLVGAGGPLLLAMYFSLYILISIPVIIFLMRLATKRDEMIFRLVGLNLVFRFLPRNVSNYGGAWVFGPEKTASKSRNIRQYDE